MQSAPAVLAALTTLRVGGPADELVAAESERELVEAVQRADAAETPLLVLGGGSNLLATDTPFEGLVVRDARRGVRVETGAEVTVSVPAGQPWDEVVHTAVAEGWTGLEALSGIPGSTGATPVQNVGAYGQEVADTLSTVRVYDRLEGRLRTLRAQELGLGYRTSILKRSRTEETDAQGRSWGVTGRYVVLEVAFGLRREPLSAPVRYAELARTLDVELGARVPQETVRAAVLALRRGKGMVLDEADHDTWSAGSFFTNPILTEAQAAELLPPDAPRFPVEDHTGAGPGGALVRPGLVKTSAAWLISRAGFERGFGDPRRAALSNKHVLALTNRGEAGAQDLLALAATVRDGVHDRFGVTLVPEPVLLGLELPPVS